MTVQKRHGMACHAELDSASIFAFQFPALTGMTEKGELSETM